MDLVHDLSAIAQLAVLSISSIFTRNAEIDRYLAGRQDSVSADPMSRTSRVIETASSIVQASSIDSLGATSTPQTGMNIMISKQSLYLHNARSLGGVFSYLASKWAFATLSSAILFNRTQFYASSRRPLYIRWHVRLLLHCWPIVTLLHQLYRLVQALKCQTSPIYSTTRHNNRLDTIEIAMGNRYLYRMSSVLIPWQADSDSCVAVGIAADTSYITEPRGSLALLWPLFISFCFSQFIETLACALQNCQPASETSITIFEHSLAFAEAEAAFNKTIGFGFFRDGMASQESKIPNQTNMNSRESLSLLHFNHRANAPIEVLLICLVATASHLSSNTLTVLGIRSKVRLLNTGIWALFYMLVFFWNLWRMLASTGEEGAIKILGFPTLCMIGFIPHILVLIGIGICTSIYLIAFTITILSLPASSWDSTFYGRFHTAYRNLQANVHLSATTSIDVSWQDDFYTALFKVGVAILTAASEAVYLREGCQVNVKARTWIEDKRMQELRTLRLDTLHDEDIQPDAGARRNFRLRNTSRPNSRAEYEGDSSSVRRGYARERRCFGTRIGSSISKENIGENGIGLNHRRGMWAMTIKLVHAIGLLYLSLIAKGVIAILRFLRLPCNADWLQQTAELAPSGSPRYPRSTWRLMYPDSVCDNGASNAPDELEVDIELMARQKMEECDLMRSDRANFEDELDDRLYTWWKSGGWWGEVDTSLDYEPAEVNTMDDDTTSLLSYSTEIGTPTSPDQDLNAGLKRRHRKSANMENGIAELDIGLDTVELATLLKPQTIEQRRQAQVLAGHLRSEKVMTRSQYQDTARRENLSLLASSRHISKSTKDDLALLRLEEEECILADFIIETRRDYIPDKDEATDLNDGTSNGLHCVVCLIKPRAILLWPCGCLSLCDDCRVGLATRNYGNCICCRTDVVAYSRLYVP